MNTLSPPPLPWTPDVCLYHANCTDGFAAAWAVALRFGATACQYLPMSYGQALPDYLKDLRVLMVDFSLKRDAMDALARQAHSVIVLDHHKTAEIELAPWRIGRHADPVDLRGHHARAYDLLYQNSCEGCLPILAYFDMNKSGARMAWEYCHPRSEMPSLLAYVEDRDLWRKRFPETRAVYAALQSHTLTFEMFSAFAADTGPLIKEGVALERHAAKIVAEIVRNQYTAPIAGRFVPHVNCTPQYASDAAEALLAANPAAPFAACWYRNSAGQHCYSLRSDDARADVSEIAKRFGGGGHRNAAGFAIAASGDPA